MSVTGIVRYGAFYGPCLELRRTIRSSLGANFIEFHDEFINVGNKEVPHAWLLHINFGYPLVDAGAELCFDSPKIEPMNFAESKRRFGAGSDFKTIPGTLEEHRGSACAVAYLYPKGDQHGDRECWHRESPAGGWCARAVFDEGIFTMRELAAFWSGGICDCTGADEWDGGWTGGGSGAGFAGLAKTGGRTTLPLSTRCPRGEKRSGAIDRAQWDLIVHTVVSKEKMHHRAHREHREEARPSSLCTP